MQVPPRSALEFTSALQNIRAKKALMKTVTEATAKSTTSSGSINANIVPVDDKGPKRPRPALSNRDIQYVLWAYFGLPLLLLWISSNLHERLLILHQQPDATGTLHFLLTRKVLLLGFPSTEILWSTIYDRTISVTCWGLTFLLVRKGWNPETRQQNIQKRWRGAILSTLLVFYSTFGRMVFLQNSKTFHQYKTPFWEAVLVGVSWATSSALIRRRLDPALCENLLQRCWKDLICGGISLGMGKYLKSTDWVVHLFESLENFLQTRFPTIHDQSIIMTKMTDAAYFFCGIEPSRFWHVFVNAWQISLLWGLPYLFIRRGMNPDHRSHYLSKFFGDALFGTLALFVGMYLKSAVKLWLPVLAQLLWAWNWDASGSSSQTDEL